MKSGNLVALRAYAHGEVGHMRAAILVLALACGGSAQEAGDVRLRLVDVVTGDPVPEVMLKISNRKHWGLSPEAEAERPLEFEAETGADGTVVFAGIPDDIWSVWIPGDTRTDDADPDGTGWKHVWERTVCQADSRIELGEAKRDTVWQIRSARDGVLSVTVQYVGTGKPVSGAVVRFEALGWGVANPPPWRSAPIMPMSPFLRSHPNGRLKVPCSPGRYRLWAYALGGQGSERVEVTVEPGTTCEVPPLVIDPGAAYPRAIGRVRSWEGNAIEEALVSVRKVNPHWIDTPAFTVCARERNNLACFRTTEGGFYEIVDLRYTGYKILRDTEGPVGVAVIADGYAIDWVDIPEPEIGDPPVVLDFVLQRPGAVTVEITDQNTGERLSGRDWAIDLYWSGRDRGEGPLRWLLEEDEHGTIRLDQIPPGHCRWELLRVLGWDRGGKAKGWQKIAQGTTGIPPREPVQIRAEVEVPPEG